MIFYDTNVFLEDAELTLPFVISSKTLQELEHIKSSRGKSEDIRAAARRSIRWLCDHHGEYEVLVLCDRVIDVAREYELDASDPDVLICCTAFVWQEISEERVHFVTKDLSCRNIAETVLKLEVEWFEKKDEITYTGFKEVSMSDVEMAFFYEHQNENVYELLINQYLIIKNDGGEIVDSYRWDGETHQPLYKKPVKSTYFDKLKPKDIYQSLMVDSIMNNTITAVSAKNGAGKSLISLMCAMNLIESGKYDHLVIMYNPTKAKGAFDQGFYSGSATEKGLQQFLGHMLASKFGDMFGVELLIQQGKIKIISLADCRGLEVRDNEILYLPEVQNTTVELIKLALSRASAGAKVIIEGDYKTQVDSYLFEGSGNGLKRVINKFKGSELFGYVELQNIWRSKLAQLAERL